ncbi:MAG TPA: hypothetical protein VEF37_05535 [Thermodesulfovibrionales bacterium]|nr:hypothetical protein [Thermodesulfovibrionales bacterium]
MLLGFNTNIIYNEDTYHIQTEDNGLKNPVIMSRLYLKGEIIATKKNSYADIVGKLGYQEKIKKMMAEQHTIMIEELLSGRYTVEDKSEGTEEGKAIQ